MGALSASAGTLQIGGGTQLDISGTATIADTVVLAHGTMHADGGMTLSAGAVLSGDGLVTGRLLVDGLMLADGGKLQCIGTAAGNGTLGIDQGAALSLHGAVGRALTINFMGAATLDLVAAASFHGMIGGWSAGDSIVLAHLDVTADAVRGQSLILFDHGERVGALRFDAPISTADFVISHHDGATVIAHA